MFENLTQLKQCESIEWTFTNRARVKNKSNKKSPPLSKVRPRTRKKITEEKQLDTKQKCSCPFPTLSRVMFALKPVKGAINFSWFGTKRKTDESSFEQRMNIHWRESTKRSSWRKTGVPQLSSLVTSLETQPGTQPWTWIYGRRKNVAKWMWKEDRKEGKDEPSSKSGWGEN